MTGLVALALTALTTGIAFAVKADPSVPYSGAPCRDDTSGTEVRSDAEALNNPLPNEPIVHEELDDGERGKNRIYGSPRSKSVDGRTYYWGRVASDDTSGGVQLLWRVDDGSWHDCRTDLSANYSGYVYTPAVASEIGGRQVTFKVCIWRNNPHLDHCWNDSGG